MDRRRVGRGAGILGAIWLVVFGAQLLVGSIAGAAAVNDSPWWRVADGLLALALGGYCIVFRRQMADSLRRGRERWGLDGSAQVPATMVLAGLGFAAVGVAFLWSTFAR